MDDDMLPNDGSYWHPEEPEEQVKERQIGISKAQAAKPMLEDLLTVFQSDIDQLNSISSIPVDINTDRDGFLQAWMIRQELLNYAKSKKTYLETLLMTTK